MLKDFFYFSKNQRVAIIILLLLIILTIAGSFVLNLIPIKQTSEDTESFFAQTEEFMRNLQSADSIRRLKQAQEYSKRYADSYLKSEQKQDYELFTFNPNTADSSSFLKLGLKPFVIKNIINYRKKGGVFKSVDNFAKVWGISDEKFEELKPYISIPAENKVADKQSNLDSESIINKPEKVSEKLVDINSADTTELMTVKGIGRKYSNGIIKYRTLLGGYYDKNQVLEVYGMTPENFEKIKDKLTVSSASVTKIDVNKASADRLRSHPYLNFYQGKAVYELRRRKGKLKNIDELKHLEEFTPDQLKKIQPYLSFD